MGANMVQRVMQVGHECVVYDNNAEVVQSLVKQGATDSTSLNEMSGKLKLLAVWLMVPAGAVDEKWKKLRPHLEAKDILIDGGNSHYIDDLRRAGCLAESNIDWIDVGVSGGTFGFNRGYCLMIGGAADAVQFFDPVRHYGVVCVRLKHPETCKCRGIRRRPSKRKPLPCASPITTSTICRFQRLRRYGGAEACGVPVTWSCTAGVCHMSDSELLDGTVRYVPAPLEQPANGNVLIHCTTPLTEL